MKHIFRAVSLITFIAVAGIKMHAIENFNVDGINYVSTDGSTCYVAKYSTTPYSGKITIPDEVSYGGKNYTVRSIEECAFQNCSLTEVNLPRTLEYIGKKAFSGNEFLTTMTFSGVMDESEAPLSICSEAFSYCTSLEEVILPIRAIFSVENEENGPFHECINLKKCALSEGCDKLPYGLSVYYPLTLPRPILDNGLIYSYDRKCIIYASIKLEDEITLENITDIEENAFAYCDKVTNISLPDGLLRVQPYAFKNCTSLQTLILPPSLKYCPQNSIEGCNLKKIAYPIIEYAPGLTYNIAGFGCAYPSDDVMFSNGYIYSSDGTKLYYVPTDVSGDYEIADNITFIGQAAFRWCDKITSIKIPDNFTKIESYSFEYCNSLSSVSLPPSIQEIGAYAFRNCANLESVQLQEHVEYISMESFAYCPKLKDVYCHAATPPECYNQFTFYPYPSTVYGNLHVMYSSADLYKEHSVWSLFNIVPGLSGVDTTFNDLDLSTGIVLFNTAGVLIYKGPADNISVPQSGAYIINQNGKSSKVWINSNTCVTHLN